MVCGILSLIVPAYGVVLAIIAICLSFSAQKRGYVGTRTKVGLVTGIIAIAFQVIAAIIIGIVFAVIMNA